MSLEARVAKLEKTVARIAVDKAPSHYRAELIAENDHLLLEDKISQWLRKVRPRRIIFSNFVADGAEYTYCAMFIYEPREMPLPDRRRRR